MNSFNHYAYGAIGDWLYADVAGIDTDSAAPGYKHIVLHPTLNPSLTSARATYESVYGKIESAWEQQGDWFEWQIVIPPNTTATVVPPQNLKLVEHGDGADKRVIETPQTLGSGTYAFTGRMTV